jgi:hypothetical protein
MAERISQKPLVANNRLIRIPADDRAGTGACPYIF